MVATWALTDSVNTKGNVDFSVKDIGVFALLAPNDDVESNILWKKAHDKFSVGDASLLEKAALGPTLVLCFFTSVSDKYFVVAAISDKSFEPSINQDDNAALLELVNNGIQVFDVLVPLCSLERKSVTTTDGS